MKHVPIILLYLAVPVLISIAAQDSVRQDRNNHSLNSALDRATQRTATQLKDNVQALRQDLDRQQEASDAQAASLRGELDGALTAAKTMQQETQSLRTKLGAELAALGKELELHANEVAGLSANVADTRNEIEPLRHELNKTARQLAAAVEQESDAREQLSLQCDAAIAEQGELLNILQQLADASRARAAAQQQIAVQAAAEAASLDRLAQQATHARAGLAADHAEVVRVAQALPQQDETGPAAADAESAEVAVEHSGEDTAVEQSVPEPPAPDASHRS